MLDSQDEQFNLSNSNKIIQLHYDTLSEPPTPLDEKSIELTSAVLLQQKDTSSEDEKEVPILEGTWSHPVSLYHIDNSRTETVSKL